MRINDNGIYREETQEEKQAREQRELDFLKTMTYAELVSYFIREKYTQDDEYALLRQRDTKVEEFATYNDYCEECKVRAREIKPNGN